MSEKKKMSKLQFRFEATADGKSNWIAITSLTTENNKKILIPEEYQSASFHDEVIKTAHFTRIKATLKKKTSNKKCVDMFNSRITESLL